MYIYIHHQSNCWKIWFHVFLHFFFFRIFTAKRYFGQFPIILHDLHVFFVCNPNFLKCFLLDKQLFLLFTIFIFLKYLLIFCQYFQFLFWLFCEFSSTFLQFQMLTSHHSINNWKYLVSLQVISFLQSMTIFWYLKWKTKYQ